MSMILKFRIVPNTNNQEVENYCDDNQCLNREGCLYADNTKGTLKPILLKKQSNVPLQCGDYNPLPDTPIIKTVESKGFEGAEKLTPLQDFVKVFNSMTSQKMRNLTKTDKLDKEVGIIINLYINDEPIDHDEEDLDKILDR